MTAIDKYWYRIDTELYGYPEEVHLRILRYVVIRNTPCGCWIASEYDRKGKYSKRWVSISARKRYAYPTLEEAFVSYQRRTVRHIGFAERRLERAKAGLKLSEEIWDSWDKNAVPPDLETAIKDPKHGFSNFIVLETEILE